MHVQKRISETAPKKIEDFFNAIESNNIDKINYYIQKGFDINIQDDDGQTALMKAIFLNSLPLSKLLIKNGADINIQDNKGQTALMKAAFLDSKKIGELLILEGADYTKSDNKGMTAYNIAHKRWAFNKEDFFLKFRPIESEIKENRIQYYFQSIQCLEDFGTIIDTKSFLNKYNFYLPDSALETFVKNYNIQNPSKKLKKIRDGSYKIVPNDKEINHFLSTKFEDKNYVDISYIKSHFFKTYNDNLGDTTLDNFIQRFNKSNQKKKLIRENNNIFVTPNDKSIQEALFELCKTELGKIYSKKEIDKNLFAKSNEERALIKQLLNNFYCKIIKISENKYTILPNDQKFISLFTDTIPDSNTFIQILKSDSIPQEFKINLRNCLVQSEGIYHIIAKLIQRKFLKEILGFTCTYQELIDCLNREYSISGLAEQEITHSIQIANSNLKDIKIISKNDILYSSFKNTNMNISSFDTKICPICGEDFSKPTIIMYLKYHILGHSSSKREESILVHEPFTYYCNHCGQTDSFSDRNSPWIFRHLLGLCKNSLNTNSLERDSKNPDKRIWNGTSYANNSAFLGNSGQLYRDNGQFGSFPHEDNYDEDF